MVAANRGLLHIHDAFGGEEDRGPSEEAYKPLLMLLGSGKASIESTQTPDRHDRHRDDEPRGDDAASSSQLTSSKLLDRIDEIPVNYLLDAYSEMDILKRDMANIREKYDVDPNLLRVATYFSVLTRLLPAERKCRPSRAGASRRRASTTPSHPSRSSSSTPRSRATRGDDQEAPRVASVPQRAHPARRRHPPPRSPRII